LVLNFECSVGYAGSQLASDVKCLLIICFRQDDGKLLATDARNPIDAAAQLILQAFAELPQYLIAARVPERVIDILEMIDIAEDQRERAPVTGRPLDFARKMFGEETPAGDVCEIVGRGKFPILDERYAQHRFELGDPARRADARVQLALG
jgi:hypothetical protein